MSPDNNSSDVVVATMYRFVRLPDFETIKPPLLEHCKKAALKGTILLAEEGFNATVAGSRTAIDGLLAYLYTDSRLRDFQYKESFTAYQPFARMKVKLKREIVTMGIPDTDPGALNGTRVAPQEWNDLITDPDVLVVDTRNVYEHAIGTFEGALSPQTESFRDLPKFVEDNLDTQQHKKVAMFCTGGIRCEKSTNYLLKQGFEQVFHLDGGILKYLETVPTEQSLWRGECFVFDERVAVDANLQPGTYTQCFACGRPLSPADRQAREYEEGISCAQCIDQTSEDRKMRLAERHRQIQLSAHRRGELI
ncbi:MAG: rhodanese-related sulfurtransferase [Chromatiales bacterium]|jgi:UPF0176 protein|nr:rhodanese-related sulfurtransferase [Chromatiales bacterium]